MSKHLVGVGDRGQKYKVTFSNRYDDKRRTFGWSKTTEGAQSMVDSINMHPSMTSPRIIDRENANDGNYRIDVESEDELKL